MARTTIPPEPCYCNALPHPHRQGSGKCKTHLERPQCRCPNCGAIISENQIEWMLWKQAGVSPAEYIPNFVIPCGKCGISGVHVM